MGRGISEKKSNPTPWLRMWLRQRSLPGCDAGVTKAQAFPKPGPYLWIHSMKPPHTMMSSETHKRSHTDTALGVRVGPSGDTGSLLPIMETSIGGCGQLETAFT